LKSGWAGTLSLGPHGATVFYRKAGKQQQHARSAVPGLFNARAESSRRTAKMGRNRDILCSEDQWAFALRKDKIADRPAGASGNNNTRV